jgi:hypothetical protein
MKSVRGSSPLLWLGSAGLLLIVPIVTAGCDDETSDDANRTCGDGICDSEHCESPVRCPDDCGACVGAECTVGGTIGTCTEPCSDSCECVNSGEFCSADYGVSPGQCLPVACLSCLHTCEASPDAQGLCSTGTCR